MNKKFSSIILALFLILNVTSAYGTDILADEAESAILMESATGKILFEKNSHKSLPPASITKIMTLLIAFEEIEKGNLSYDTNITSSDYAKSMGGSTIFLDTGETMKLNDIIKAIVVASANDASVALAEHISGSCENFVVRMNKKAKELGMKDTNFVNCNGLDTENHYSSAYDIALMSRELIKHKDIFKYTMIWTDSIRDGNFLLANTNKLIRFYKGANGLKTGSTSNAGCCISATAERDGMQLIAVILNAPDSKKRFKYSSDLLNYGFENYSLKLNYNKNHKVKEIRVENGNKEKINLISDRDSYLLLNKNEKCNIKERINCPEKLIPPIKKGDVIGEIIYTSDKETLSTIELLASEDIQKKKQGKYFKEIIKQIFT